MAILIGFLKKGSLTHLSRTEIHYPSFIIGSFLVQALVILLDDRFLFYKLTGDIWLTVTYLVLAFAIWANRKIEGFTLIGLGILLNFIVIMANGGRMPVSSDAIDFIGLSHLIPTMEEGLSKHVLMDSSTHFSWLGDIFPLKPPYSFKRVVVSIGDILVTVGVARFVYIRMKKEQG